MYIFMQHSWLSNVRIKRFPLWLWESGWLRMLEEQQCVLPRNLSGTVPPGQPASWREPRHTEGCAQPRGVSAHTYSQESICASVSLRKASIFQHNTTEWCFHGALHFHVNKKSLHDSQSAVRSKDTRWWFEEWIVPRVESESDEATN